MTLICTANSQEPQHVLSNSDIVNMAKSGIGDATIILTIQRSSTKFDTSPDALIQLKSAGLSDAVLNAMLASPGNSAQPSQQDCSGALDKLLSTYGTADKLASLTASRYVSTSVISNASGSKTNHLERVTIWSGSIRATLQPTAGEGSTVVVTPEFNYMIAGKMTTLIPPAILQDLQSSLRLDPLYIAKHRDEYSCVSAGTEQIGSVSTTKLNDSEWCCPRAIQSGHEHWSPRPDYGHKRQRTDNYGPFRLETGGRSLHSFQTPFCQQHSNERLHRGRLSN